MEWAARFIADLRQESCTPSPRMPEQLPVYWLGPVAELRQESYTQYSGRAASILGQPVFILGHARFGTTEPGLLHTQYLGAAASILAQSS